MERRYKLLYIDNCRTRYRWSRTMRVLSFREQYRNYVARTDTHADAKRWFNSFLDCYDSLTEAK
jgi:hypothetical protein